MTRLQVIFRDFIGCNCTWYMIRTQWYIIPLCTYCTCTYALPFMPVLCVIVPLFMYCFASSRAAVVLALAFGVVAVPCLANYFLWWLCGTIGAATMYFVDGTAGYAGGLVRKRSLSDTANAFISILIREVQDRHVEVIHK